MTDFTFDPDRVAQAEANGWRAYYDRDWFKLLRLLVAMNEAQFRIPPPVSWLAAYYVVRASVLFVPRDHDLSKVGIYLEKFYKLARRHSGLIFDPAQAAEIEVKYWVIHRELAIAKQADKTEFIDALTALHSLLFDLTPERARESAELRVRANNIVDGITGKTSVDVEGDWHRLEELLRQCYHSLRQQLNSKDSQQPVRGEGPWPISSKP